jgi:hypothetical protein
VLTLSIGIPINIYAKLNICSLNAPTSPIPKPLAAIMKTLIIISFLLPLVAFGQTPKRLTLELSTGDCRKNQHVRIGYRDTIQFFQDNKLSNQIVPMNYHQWPIDIEDFNSGTYKVVYRNLYGKQVSKFITIPDTTDEYELKLCPDELMDYSLNSLSALKDNETIKVSFSSSGCFHQDRETLIITRKDKKYIAKLTTKTYKETKTKSATLNQAAIDAFKRFENEIRQVEDSYGCTTVDTYTIFSKSWTIKRTDGGCAWDGFYFLKKEFFGKTE